MVKGLIKSRSKAAELICTLRAKRGQDGQRLIDNELVRIHLKMSGLLGLTRPTAAAFIKEAVECEAFARTPVRQQGNEYYSACGLEDAMGEARDQAAEYAQELREAAASLVPFGWGEITV